MSKQKTPLASAHAAGAIGKEVVYFRRRGQEIARKYVPYPKLPPLPIIPPEIEMQYTEIYSPIIYPPSATGWFEKDLSAYVPAGSKAVELAVIGAGVAFSHGARKKGSTLDRRFTHGFLGATFLMSEIDDDRKIELYEDNPFAVQWRVIGYWK